MFLYQIFRHDMSALLYQCRHESDAEFEAARRINGRIITDNPLTQHEYDEYIAEVEPTLITQAYTPKNFVESLIDLLFVHTID